METLNRQAMRIAVDAPCSLPVAKKALIEGTDGMRAMTRERVERAAKRLGITLGLGRQATAPMEPVAPADATD